MHDFVQRVKEFSGRQDVLPPDGAKVLEHHFPATVVLQAAQTPNTRTVVGPTVERRTTSPTVRTTPPPPHQQGNREPVSASPRQTVRTAPALQQSAPIVITPPKPSAPPIPPEEEIRTVQAELKTLEEQYKTLPKTRSNEAEAIRLSNQIHTLKNRLNVLQAGL
jgi:hypothetical protein